MTQNGKDEPFRLGFLSALEIENTGYVGGLLVTNHQGRPLEFQCTTPVKPNSTQQILYGPTLVSFILTELIGTTLVQQLSAVPDILLTQQAEMLELGKQIEIPVALLLAEGDNLDPSLDSSQIQTVEQHRLCFHKDTSDTSFNIEGFSQLPQSADLHEPFDRVRDALLETLGKRAA